jgi:predicted negative regulator of RcsB-dependent stress response
MSNNYKEQKKALKQPDQFQAKGIVFLDWLMKNTNKLVIVAVPVVLVFVASAGYKHIQEQRRDKRLEELGKVQVVYEDEQRAAFKQRQEIAKQIEEIDKKINPTPAAAPAPADPAKPAPAPVAASPDPKLVLEKTVLEKKMEDIKADHTKSIGLFAEYFKKHEATPEGWMAGMTNARLLTEQEKVAEAKPVLENVVKLSKESNFYQTQSRLALIGVLEELSDFDGALAQVDALDKTVDADLKPKILLAKGRLQMLKNSNADAKATFNTLIETHGTSPEAQKARSIQSLLN